MRWLLLLIFLLTTIGCAGSVANPPAPPTLSPQAQLGQKAFTTNCGSCHSLAPDTKIVGPSLAGIGSRAAERVPGEDANTYLLTSIIKPEAYLVAGFDNLMPSTFGKSLTGEEVDGLVAYLLTLK